MVLVLSIVVVTLSGTTLTLLSPVFLRQLDTVPQVNWDRLSQIGQTYGATSAILSAFALIGVAYSLILQARENQAGRKESGRAFHAQLMDAALRDPIYLECWGGLDTRKPPEVLRQHLYLNLILSYWEMLYDIGEIPDSVLRELVRVDFFATAAAQEFWQGTRAHRLEAAKNRRMRRFHEILEEEFAAATPRAREPRKKEPPLDPKLAALVVGALTVGVAAGRLVTSRRRNT